jgi:hypothetical protein
MRNKNQHHVLSTVAQSRAARLTCCSTSSYCLFFAKINPLHLRARAYSTSSKGMPHWYTDKLNDEALQKLDIDAIEAFSKQRFGDATTWSHDQLLKLMVCKLDFTKIESVH